MLMAGLLLLALVATLSVVQWNLKQDQARRFESELARVRQSLTSRMQQRHLLLETLAHTQAVNPSLLGAMKQTDGPVLETLLEDIREEGGVNVILLTDSEGKSLAGTGYTQDSAIQWEGVQFAVKGKEAVDYWLLSQGLQQVCSVPVISGEQVVGTLSMGRVLDAEFVKNTAQETGVEILLLSGGNVLAGSFEVDEKVQIRNSSSHTLKLDGREFRFRSFALDGTNRAMMILLDDVSLSTQLLNATRDQLLLIGGFTFLLALALSWPLVDRVTVSSELLETVVQKVGEGLCQLDKDGIILRVNPEGERLFGLSQQQLIGKKFDEVVTVIPGPLNWEDDFRLDDVVCKTSKAAFPASLVATSFSAESGQNGTVLIVRDISHVKEAEEELRNAALAKANFLAHMSHEIRTPMNGVLGMNSLLLETPLSETQARYAQIMDSSGRALLEIIDDVLEHSKLDAGAVRLELVEFELWEVLEDVASLLALRAYDKGIELFLTIDRKTPNKVCSDPSRLRQVLLNLVGNAIKFTTSGYVHLSLKQVENRLRFTVEDTGIGIREEVQEQLFTDFAQAEGSTSRLFGGTGLGLSISQRLVTLLGGQIQLESRLGEGSRFWFEIEQTGACWQEPEFLGPGRVNLVLQQGQRQESLEKLLEYWRLEIDDGADVHLIEGAELNRLAEQTRCVILCKPGEEREGALCCPLPLRTKVLHSALKKALAGESPEVSVPRPSSFTKTSSHAPLVMVVDDNAVNREVAEASLAQLGYRSLSAECGPDALKQFAELKIDAVLMDCEMPGMDGYETSIKIRETDSDVPIIALTAAVKAESHAKIEASGMNALIRKPFRLDELGRELQSLGLMPDFAQEMEQKDEGPSTQKDLVLNLEKLAFLRSLREDNPHFVEELIAGYLEEFDQMMERMKMAKIEQRWDDVVAQAHKQRGAAGNLGLEKLRTSCRELEERPAPQPFGDFQEAAQEARLALESYIRESGNLTP